MVTNAMFVLRKDCTVTNAMFVFRNKAPLFYEKNIALQKAPSRSWSGLPKAKCKAPRRTAEPRKGRLTKGGMLPKNKKNRTRNPHSRCGKTYFRRKSYLYEIAIVAERPSEPVIEILPAARISAIELASVIVTL